MRTDQILEIIEHWNHENGNFIHSLRGWTDLLKASKEGLNPRAIDKIIEIEDSMVEHGRVLSGFLEILEEPGKKISKERAKQLIQGLSKKYVRDKQLHLSFPSFEGSLSKDDVTGADCLKFLETVIQSKSDQRLECNF